MTKSSDDRFVEAFLTMVKGGYRFDGAKAHVWYYSWRDLRALAGTIHELRIKVKQLENDTFGEVPRETHDVLRQLAPQPYTGPWPTRGTELKKTIAKQLHDWDKPDRQQRALREEREARAEFTPKSTVTETHEPIRPLRAPDGGKHFAGQCIFGSWRGYYGEPWWPSSCYWLLPTQDYDREF